MFSSFSWFCLLQKAEKRHRLCHFHAELLKIKTKLTTKCMHSANKYTKSSPSDANISGIWEEKEIASLMDKLFF